MVEMAKDTLCQALADWLVVKDVAGCFFPRLHLPTRVWPATPVIIVDDDDGDDKDDLARLLAIEDSSIVGGVLFGRFRPEWVVWGNIVPDEF